MKYLNIIASIFLLIILSACAERSFKAIYPTLSDGHYDSEFPYRNCSKQLSEISKSIHKIDCLVFYQTYLFNEKDQVSEIDLTSKDILDLSIKGEVITKSVIGTATTIYYDHERVALLSCAHVLNFKDTVISYYDSDKDAHKYIQSIAIKSRQQNIVAGLPSFGSLEILAMDEENDIAILGKEIDYIETKIPVFKYPSGKSEELEWGSFVYVMGYPMGFQMITKGIISSPDRIKNGSILIDAVFNRGFSGGLVLAIKDGVPNFEMVGMARSASANVQEYFSPGAREKDNIPNPNIPYIGPVYLKTKEEINYGITYAVPIEFIKAFYKKHQEDLKKRGYQLDYFFKI
jgi:hypothetical protein